jgi:Holliday junction resolvase-like predicted endonuclease
MSTTGERPKRRTDRQLAGDAAEVLVAERLAAIGWRVLARNVHCGRSELDIVAIDPGPPGRLVVVEVRWRSSREFGSAEDSFDFRKRAHLTAGIGRLVDAGRLPDGVDLPRLPLSLDLAVVEPGPAGKRSIRLYRNALLG